MSSFIDIENLVIHANHGVFPEERENGQTFKVSMKLYTDMEKAAATDELNDAVDYGSVCHDIEKFMTERSFKLIEAAADYVAVNIMLKYQSISRLELKLSKPEAPVNMEFEDISVNITKERHEAYIALGSNIGDSKAYLNNAIKSIDENPYCKVLKISDFITTKPYGYTEQPDFLNGAIKIETLLSPYQLLDLLREIENNNGRTREIHWGPRTLDLDILFYDDLVTEDDMLTIPHPEIEKRDFVLIPLRQISPLKVHPLLNKRITDIPNP